MATPIKLIVTFVQTLHEIAKLQFRLASQLDPYYRRSKPRAGEHVTRNLAREKSDG
jgi:hypothetical protein